MQQDSYSLRGERDAPLFKGWTAKDPNAEKARAMIERWDHVLTRDSAPAALYVRWSTSESGRKAVEEKSAATKRALTEQGLTEAIARATKDWGADWSQWRYGRVNESKLPHMFIDEYSLAAGREAGRVQQRQCDRRELPPRDSTSRTSTRPGPPTRRDSRRSREAPTTATFASTWPTACTTRCRSNAPR